MRSHERYVLTLALMYALTVVVLAFYHESRLELYVSLMVLEYFVVTLLLSPTEPRVTRGLNVIGVVLFAIFMLIVADKVMRILYGVGLF